MNNDGFIVSKREISICHEMDRLTGILQEAGWEPAPSSVTPVTEYEHDDGTHLRFRISDDTTSLTITSPTWWGTRGTGVNPPRMRVPRQWRIWSGNKPKTIPPTPPKNGGKHPGRAYRALMPPDVEDRAASHVRVD